MKSDLDDTNDLDRFSCQNKISGCLSPPTKNYPKRKRYRQCVNHRIVLQISTIPTISSRMVDLQMRKEREKSLLPISSQGRLLTERECVYLPQRRCPPERPCTGGRFQEEGRLALDWSLANLANLSANETLCVRSPSSDLSF